jgi:peptidoglycan/xylan/chitin deacetylase (PgdA/CDA1 family)
MQLVLTYHRVVERAADVKDFFDVTLPDFERHIALARELWQRPLAPADLVQAPQDLSRRQGFLITFDDGTVDHFTIAAPVLERHGLRGVFFVSPGELGLNDTMTLAQCVQLQARGHHVESHSHDHVILTHLPDSELQWQLTEGRRRLRDEGLGTHDFISVPGGFVDGRVRRAAAVAGYRLLRTLAWGYNRHGDPLHLDSITMNQQTAGRYCAALMSPRGATAKKCLYRAKELVKLTGPYFYFPLRDSGAGQSLRGQ